MAKMFRALITGPPGSGKGTISKRIIQNFNLEYLASGDALRSQVLQATDLGLLAQKYIRDGHLVPDDLITKLVLQHLKSFSSRSWLLDGFPRTVKQAESLSKQYDISVAIFLNVPDEEILSRLKERWIHIPSGRIYHLKFSPPKVTGKDDITGEPLTQREDDLPRVVKARLDLYKEQNLPVLEYYRKKHLLEEFAGRQSDEIWPRVKAFLKQSIK